MRKTTPAFDRLVRKLRQDGDCWIFTGALNAAGYGKIGKAGANGWDLAHRVTYEYLRAEIPSGLVIDHLCRNRACVNPWHLEPVTPTVNHHRGNARLHGGAHLRKRSHCNNGHPFDEQNTAPRSDGKGRQCRTCRRESALRRYYESRAA